MRILFTIFIEILMSYKNFPHTNLNICINKRNMKEDYKGSTYCIMGKENNKFFQRQRRGDEKEDI